MNPALKIASAQRQSCPTQDHIGVEWLHDSRFLRPSTRSFGHQAHPPPGAENPIRTHRLARHQREKDFPRPLGVPRSVTRSHFGRKRDSLLVSCSISAMTLAQHKPLSNSQRAENSQQGKAADGWDGGPSGPSPRSDRQSPSFPCSLSHEFTTGCAGIQSFPQHTHTHTLTQPHLDVRAPVASFELTNDPAASRFLSGFGPRNLPPPRSFDTRRAGRQQELIFYSCCRPHGY